MNCAYCWLNRQRHAASLTVCGTSCCQEHAVYAFYHHGGADPDDPPTKRGTRPSPGGPRPAVPGRLDVPH